jgi:hypothetical protein
MSDLGLLSYYLGIEVKQGLSAITLGASSLCEEAAGEGGPSFL